MEKTSTTCIVCSRAVWTTDVDQQGVCVLCAPPPAVVEGGPDTPVTLRGRRAVVPPPPVEPTEDDA